MKILHTSDLHLRKEGDERWDALEKLVEIGTKERVEVFVISGDLFDKEINAEELRPKMRKIFSNNRFKVLIIPGNHDRTSFERGKDYGRDVIILDDLNNPFEQKGVRIWGLPFEDIGENDVLRRLYPLKDEFKKEKIEILLFHGELRDPSFERDDFGEEEGYMPVKISLFENLNFKYVLAGHYHRVFSVKNIEEGRYFVYSGSPVSIKKGERTQRMANLFEVGEEPKEYPLDTFHYVESVVEFEPFMEENPLKMIEGVINSLHPKAKPLLRVKGFINTEKIGMDEEKLHDEIERIVKEKCGDVEDVEFEVSDVKEIIENPLFQTFLKKIEKYDEKTKKELYELVINAIRRAIKR